MDVLIVYRMEIVGGPFDGCGEGMKWLDDGRNPPPELILLGVCPGNGSCSASRSEDCASHGKKHPYYWLPDEEKRPAKTTPYELEDSFLLEREEGFFEHPGRARYVIAGLTLPRQQSERELVGAGSGPGVGRSMESRVHAGYPGELVGVEGPGELHG